MEANAMEANAMEANAMAQFSEVSLLGQGSYGR